MDMMREAIEKRAGQTLIAEDARPFLEWKIGCYDRRPVFVTLAEDLKEQFRAGVDSGAKRNGFKRSGFECLCQAL